MTAEDRGRTVEVSFAGFDGLIGLPALLEADSVPYAASVRIAGMALRIGAAKLLDALERSRSLRRLVKRYVQARLTITAQVATCNARHDLRQRLGRWLLRMRDRLDSDDIPFSHKEFAQMLGVRRASITVAMQDLERAGAIRQGLGRITISNRDMLQAQGCDCYRIVTREYERLVALGP